MQTVKKAKLLRLHFGESDQYNGKPLYEAIVNRCKELKLPGQLYFADWKVTGRRRKSTAITSSRRISPLSLRSWTRRRIWRG